MPIAASLKSSILYKLDRIGINVITLQRKVFEKHFKKKNRGGGGCTILLQHISKNIRKKANCFVKIALP